MLLILSLASSERHKSLGLLSLVNSMIIFSPKFFSENYTKTTSWLHNVNAFLPSCWYVLSLYLLFIISLEDCKRKKKGKSGFYFVAADEEQKTGFSNKLAAY